VKQDVINATVEEGRSDAPSPAAMPPSFIPLTPRVALAQKTRLALLGLWVGAAAFFSFFVAPGAFAVLPTRHLAGQLVSRTLAGLEISGMALGLMLLLLLLAARPPRRRAFLLELVVTLLMTASMAVSRFIVSARLHELRVRLGEGLDLLPRTDPTRASFDWLHQVSVGLLSFNLLAALLLIAFLIWRDRPPGRRA
jgi:hypothetical protein